MPKRAPQPEPDDTLPAAKVIVPPAPPVAPPDPPKVDHEAVALLRHLVRRGVLPSEEHKQVCAYLESIGITRA